MNLKIGILYSVFTVFLWAFYNVLVRVCAINWDINAYVFVSFTCLTAALTLLVIAGNGNLGVKTIRQYHTWLYSFLNVFADIIGVFVLLMITATQSTLMMRLGIIVTAVICRVALGRKINSRSYFGFLLVSIGFILVASNLPADVQVLSIFLIFVIIMCQALKTYITETHPASNEAKTWLDNCRVTGYVTLITSIAFFIMGLSIGFAKSMLSADDLNSLVLLGSFPDLVDFIHPQTVFAATLIGIFNVSLSSYFYFQATKKLGADGFLMVAAMLPVFAYLSEVGMSYFGILELKPLGMVDLIAAILIIAGALWSIYVKIYLDKRKRKIAPKAKKELQILRDTIQTAMVCFDDNEDEVAEKLGVGKRTLKQIMTKEKEVSENIKNKIIFNHAQNVAGLDHLTGALNKSSFESKLKGLKNAEKALIIFVDLNRFKPVNDTYGHKVGDIILEGVADRLMEEFKTPHAVARLGGDEFCLIIYGKDKKDSNKIVRKIKNLITEPFIVEGVKNEISVGCSIGAAHYPSEGIDGLELNKVADERMYEVKLANRVGR